MANLRTAPLLLDEVAVRRHLRMSELLPAMEQALQDFSAGKVVQPARGAMAIEPAGGHLFWMPARSEALGVKIVTLYPSNAGRGLPTHMATILLLEPATGAPLAIMDGRLITEMRTAAVSAVATRLLSSADARVLAILGSGVQARSHYQALALVRSFAEVRIWISGARRCCTRSALPMISARWQRRPSARSRVRTSWLPPPTPRRRSCAVPG